MPHIDLGIAIVSVGFFFSMVYALVQWRGMKGEEFYRAREDLRRQQSSTLELERQSWRRAEHEWWKERHREDERGLSSHEQPEVQGKDLPEGWRWLRVGELVKQGDFCCDPKSPAVRIEVDHAWQMTAQHHPVRRPIS
jgi:hypothetical protein